MVCDVVLINIGMTIFVLRLKIWCLYEHSLQHYTLIFNRCAFMNFMVKRLLQYKTKHATVILQENIYSTRTLVRRNINCWVPL